MKTFYTSLKAKLIAALPQIAHFGKWNNQLVNLADEIPFERPALFIEIEPVQWEIVNKRQKKGNFNITLHIVSDSYDTFADDAASLATLDLCDQVTQATEASKIANCTPFLHNNTAIDNDHGNLIEDRITFSTSYTTFVSDGKTLTPVTPDLNITGEFE